MSKEIIELRSLRIEDLEILHTDVVSLRETVLELVQKYGYSAETLVSKTFEHEIERWYGYRTLKEKTKTQESQS